MQSISKKVHTLTKVILAINVCNYNINVYFTFVQCVSLCG